MNTSVDSEKRFDWPLCHEAESYLLGQLDAFIQRNRFAGQLAERMRDETGTLLLDWVDHVILAPAEIPALQKVGYVVEKLVEVPAGFQAWWHPEAMVPRILIQEALE